MSVVSECIFMYILYVTGVYLDAPAQVNKRKRKEEEYTFQIGRKCNLSNTQAFVT